MVEIKQIRLAITKEAFEAVSFFIPRKYIANMAGKSDAINPNSDLLYRHVANWLLPSSSLPLLMNLFTFMCKRKRPPIIE